MYSVEVTDVNMPLQDSCVTEQQAYVPGRASLGHVNTARTSQTKVEQHLHLWVTWERPGETE